MTHILRTSTEHKTASLADEGNSEYSQSRGALGTFCSRERCLNRSATAPKSCSKNKISGLPCLRFPMIFNENLIREEDLESGDRK